jgi:hypothetical protein
MAYCIPKQSPPILGPVTENMSFPAPEDGSRAGFRNIMS